MTILFEKTKIKIRIFTQMLYTKVEKKLGWINLDKMFWIQLPVIAHNKLLELQ